MSLVTDKFFAAALTSSSEVTTAVNGRIMNTVDDEIDPDSVQVPYIIICNDGTTNESQTKDDDYEGDTDTDTVRLIVCARSRSKLGELTELIRTTVRNFANEQDSYSETFGFVVVDYSFKASPVQFDDLKPCYHQDLIYECDTQYI